MPEPAFSVSEFVAVCNQTLEYAYPSVVVQGELANFRVSKNRWVYFDLKDETASVKFFGTVYQLSGPLEDGMVVAVRGVPRLHAQYGFSITVMNIQPVGEGAIKKAAQLLQAKLAAEGLFDPDRKRPLPYPPKTIGLITSSESAAYRDFVKVLAARWGGVYIVLADVQVQGEAAIPQIVQAIEMLNQYAAPPEVLVITRGGGSAEDLQAFSSEQVTRAVAASRIPTMVAIGHEVDVSLSELAADQRASTPSNAAELLVPDRLAMVQALEADRQRLARLMHDIVQAKTQQLVQTGQAMQRAVDHALHQARQQLQLRHQVLQAFNPHAALQRGYALVRQNGEVVRSGRTLAPGAMLAIQLADAQLAAELKQITMERHGQ